jgi:cephalosporin-C deacetylase
MPLFDLPLDRLRSYRPAVAEPDDFDDFWERTLVESRTVDAGMSLVPVESGLSEVDVVDVTFPGFAGDPIKGWFLTPRHRPGRLPAIVEYLGYGGGRGLPHDRLAWVAAGYAHFVMDTRGQGSAWGSGGETPDPHGSGPATPGFLTRGIDDPQSYYYRRVYTDAVRAVDAVRQLDRVDAGRVAVCGGSQGGGIAIAVAGLVKDVRAVMPDVPFLSHFSRAFELVDRDPYAEVVKYLSVHRDREDAVRRTLSYFDGVSFARRAQAPALYSVALMDPVCPPSTVFASFNQYGGPAEIEVYPYNQHEGGGAHHWRRQAQWLSGLA